ncbi:MAG: hypothetical protein U5L96_10660 [Owenweeksia sp.]|nr:hypothetical protein [Owenweeksia sp.]
MCHAHPDAVQQHLGDSVKFDGSYITVQRSLRDLCDLYLQQQPWGDLGIDLCLGLPMDKQAAPYEYMFLPDYIESGFNHAQVRQDGDWQPLVKETIVTYQPKPQAAAKSLLTPFVLFTILLLFGLWLTYRGYRRGKGYFVFDIIIFSIIGLVGWLLVFLWFFTDHAAAAGNFNLLWAVPLHFPLATVLFRRKKPAWLAWYYRLVVVVLALTLVGWPIWPQDLNMALLPLLLLLLVRTIFIQQWITRQYRGEFSA